MNTNLFHDPKLDSPSLRLTKNAAVGWNAPNGAKILRSAIAPGVFSREFVVLCLWENQFVTWRLVLRDDDTSGECFWGNYYGADLAAAVNDFEQRIAP